MKGKAKAVLLIIIFLLVLAVVCTFLVGRDGEKPDDAEEDASGTGEITIIAPDDSGSGHVIETPPAVSTAPQATPVPTSTPTPTPTPTPVPTPSAKPEPGPVNGSGSFRSGTGAKIDIRADWSWRSAGAGRAEVTVKVVLESYSLHLQAVPGSVNINLGGQYVSLDAPAVDYDGAQLITTTLAEKTFTADIPDDGRLNLAVEWHFGGTYGDVELPVIECGGTIDLNS